MIQEGASQERQAEKAEEMASPLKPPEETKPCQYVDFRRMSSRTIRKLICGALIHQVCDLLQEQLETDVHPLFSDFSRGIKPA